MNTTLKALLVSTAFAAGMVGNASYAAGPDSLLHFVASESVADLKAMEGKRVLGKNRELLGHIGKVDEQAKLVELKTPVRRDCFDTDRCVDRRRRRAGGAFSFARRHPRIDR